MIMVLGSPMEKYSKTSPCIIDRRRDRIASGGCGIEIEKRGSPIVMLLMRDSEGNKT